MIVFDYTCKKCNITEERIVLHDEKDEQYCNKCGEKMKREFPLFKKEIFEPYVDYYLDEKPVYLTSKKQKEKLMLEKGVWYYNDFHKDIK
ncbi:MAG: hypothetical protein ACK4UJ_12695 [Leptonema sp. (in: bacteria)]